MINLSLRKRSRNFASFLALSLSTINNSCNAQEAVSLYAPQFETSICHKQNYCDRQREIYNGTKKIPDALSGLKLNCGILVYESKEEREFYFNLRDDGTIDEKDPGLFAEILDEVARRGNFTWRDSFGILRDPRVYNNKTWVDLLDWSIQTYDVSVDYWMKAETRLARGIYFPEGFFDSSIVVISHKDQAQIEDDTAINWMAFWEPFEPSVWALIAFFVLVTGLIYRLLEIWNPLADERTALNEKEDMIFYTSMTLLQHLLFRPQTHPARILAFSWTFCALIIGSAYTANLASFLVAQHRPIILNPFDSAIRGRVPICALATTYTDTFVTSRYPKANIIRKLSEPDIFEALHKGECKFVFAALSVWQQYERVSATNPDCRFAVSKMLKIVPSGFATSIDTDGGNCTSLVGNVLNYHLSVMKDDGFIDDVWNRILQKIGDQTCDRRSQQSNDGMRSTNPGVKRFSPKDMAGIFLLHAILSLISVFIAIWSFLKRVYEAKRSSKNSPIYSPKKNDDFYPDETGSRSESTVRQSMVEIPQGLDETHVSTEFSSMIRIRKRSSIYSLDITAKDEKFGSPANNMTYVDHSAEPLTQVHDLSCNDTEDNARTFRRNSNSSLDLSTLNEQCELIARKLAIPMPRSLANTPCPSGATNEPCDLHDLSGSLNISEMDEKCEMLAKKLAVNEICRSRRTESHLHIQPKTLIRRNSL